MEKGLKTQHPGGQKKKFRSPLSGKRPHKTSILPKFAVNLNESDKPVTKTKHGGKRSKLMFQMGGDSTDPLNLNSLIDRDPADVTPQCSPLVDRMKELSPQVVIARDQTDPLNLKCDLYQDLKGIVVMTPAKKKKKRKRNDSGCFDDEQENKTRKETDVNKEDLASPKLKKKKMQKPKDGKEGKIKEKIKDVKENSKVAGSEKEIDNASGASTGQKLKEEGNFSEDLTDKKEESINDKKIISRENSVTDKDTSSVPEKTQKLEERNSSSKHHKKSRKTFHYGNYNRYYGYRNPKFLQDPRLKLFHQEWFEDKTVLDIGCNTGNVTLEIARDFSPRHVLGIDIDSSLITTANKCLRCTIQENLRKKPAVSAEFPMSFMVCHGPIVARTSPTEGRTGYPYNVQFKEENFVPQNEKSLAKQKPTYDVILCLSLTKWIHLNWGDEGLKRAFQRMFLLLNPGGRLLLEAQPFNSYSRRKNLSEQIRKNYNSIKFTPNQFVDYLMSEDVGFASYEALGVAENNSKGFQRPIYVFTKSVSGESYDALGVNIAENRRNMNLKLYDDY
ncbi:probable RNA methyltransferase Y17G7B.18 [Dendronephthya gigantea]|uniref:probable RNA methyltransferase Y17G7B.18 n=1 Tax=Dendronephthya gigantea TaxID=151771 RepID=UPI0010693976|nr:probable RNA methyltransferase Y17G7B.18 [Dendronephthya gigantea]